MICLQIIGIIAWEESHSEQLVFLIDVTAAAEYTFSNEGIVSFYDGQVKGMPYTQAYTQLDANGFLDSLNKTDFYNKLTIRIK